MNLFRRYWPAVLILIVVVAHATIIGYVRSRVARLTHTRSSAIEIGTFRFQSSGDLDKVYHFRLHAIADPSRRIQAEDALKQVRVEIKESAEQLLRQVEPKWLVDPTHAQIRDRLMDIVGRHLNEPLVQRVLITDWLELPVLSLAALPEST